MNDLYLLQDGTYANPGDCSVKDGVLQNKSGVGVALKADGSPETLADTTRNNEQAIKAGEKSVNEARADVGVKPVPEAPAVNREVKAGNVSGKYETR